MTSPACAPAAVLLAGAMCRGALLTGACTAAGTAGAAAAVGVPCAMRHAAQLQPWTLRAMAMQAHVGGATRAMCHSTHAALLRPYGMSIQAHAGGAPCRHFATRQQLLQRLRQAKADEMQAQQQRAPSGLLQDRRFWLLMAGGVAACGWAYSLLGGYSVTERVFLDIDVDGARAGRVVVGVHGSAVPRAGVNFTELASHVRGYGYRGCAFYDVVPRFAVVGGDVTKNDGTGGAAALGPSFAKEKSPLKHARGTVSMIADDDSAVRSQFFICCAMAPSLDGQMVPFGTVLEGMDVVDRLSCLPADEATRRPLSPAVIADCGVLEGGGRGASVEGLLDSALGWLLASGGGGGRT